MTMFKAALLDFDGVIADSEPWYFEAHRKTVARRGIELDNDTYRKHGMNRSSKAFYKHLGIEDIEEARNEFFEEFIKSKDSINLMPGVEPLLSQLKGKRIVHAVVTAAPKEYAKGILKSNGVEIAHVFGREDFGSNKPSPEPYLHAAQQLGIRSEECFVVEDSEQGVESAKAAGMYCYGYKTYWNGWHDLSAADEQVTSLEQILS